MGQNAQAVLSQYPGGTLPIYNITATGSLKAASGCLYQLIVQNVGTSGSITFSDMLTGGTPAAGNQILTLTTAQLTAAPGGILKVEWPFKTGLNVSAISGGIIVNASIQ
jgi:hypothetical protein